jgi:drug/metabolite transporter (DMT)-like permease
MSSDSALAPSSSQTQPPRWALWSSFAAIYLIWGSTFLGIKVAVESIPPLLTAAVRFLISGTIMLLVTSRIRPRPSLRQWSSAAIVGALFFLCNHGLVSSAARFIPSSLASLIAAIQVPIIAVLSSLLLPNQPLTRQGVLGAALGLSGVLCLFVGQGAQAEMGHLWASLAILGAASAWALGAIFSQRLPFPPSPLLRSGMQMICGGILLSLVSVVRAEPWRIELAAVSTRSLVSLAYLTVFGSILAFGCYTYLLKHVRTDLVATHVFVNPLVAVALGIWLAGEHLRPAHLLAGLLILASVSVITLGVRRAPALSARLPSPSTPPAVSGARSISRMGTAPVSDAD